MAVLGAAVLFGTTGTAKELGPDSASALGVGGTRILFGAVTLWLIARALRAGETYGRTPGRC